MSAVSYSYSSWRDSIYNYDPNVPAAFVGIGSFMIVTGVHAWILTRYRAWLSWSLHIGLILECVGHVTRAISINKNTNVPAFFISYVAILLAPYFIAISCFITFDRIVWCVTPLKEHDWKLLWFNTRYFITALVGFTLLASLIQLIGACMAGSIFTQQLLSDGTDPECITVLKAGLWMQLIGFIIYTIIGLRFCFVSRRWATQQGARYTLPTGANLVQLSWVNQAVTIVITLRTIFRLVEVMQSGPKDLGEVVLYEWPLWVFDILPMLAICILLCIFHPGKHLPIRMLKFWFSKTKAIKEAEGVLSGYDLAKLVGVYPDIDHANLAERC